MLANLNLGDGQNLGTASGKIALDCSVRETRQGNFVISTTDFFFPLVDSPYLQGRIGAANVLSDLYAEGVEHCDFVLMLLAACREMPTKEREICTSEMVKGFRDACDEAETAITGGQTVLNPWPIIGGVATSVVAKGEFVPSDGAQAGNLVVLTKPLGTQIAVNVHQWRNTSGSKHWKQIVDDKVITEDQAEEMMHQAVCSMARLNKNGGRLMLKHGAKACTDVTGFGILGHAQNLMDNQVAEVGMELHTLPLIAGTKAVNDKVFNFRLTIGYSAETSGGLMVCLPADQADAYMNAVKEADGSESWIIGRVVEDANRKAKIVEDVKYLEEKRVESLKQANQDGMTECKWVAQHSIRVEDDLCFIPDNNLGFSVKKFPAVVQSETEKKSPWTYVTIKYHELPSSCGIIPLRILSTWL